MRRVVPFPVSCRFAFCASLRCGSAGGSTSPTTAQETEAAPSGKEKGTPSSSTNVDDVHDKHHTPTMVYRPRWKYSAPFRSKSLTDFFWSDQDRVISIAHTYRHAQEDITVTLIPIRHLAHPIFFQQVDELCCQHQSVLMEGRVPLQNAPYSTFVHPRPPTKRVRPLDQEDEEGWEPREVEKFFQPFSWGVAESPEYTVVHAADKYDYEKLPIWCSVRFNTPLLGSLAREKHCLDMIYPLKQNGYKSFAIPWGALHMPIFHEMLLDNGFELQSMCSLLVLQRVDGNISEGECSAVWRIQRRRQRRIYWVYLLGFLLSCRVVLSSVKVQYTSGSTPE